MINAPYVDLDTETTGLTRPRLPGGRRIWEIGGTRVDPDGTERGFHMFIDLRDLDLPSLLPEGLHARAALQMGVLDITDPALDHSWYDLLPEQNRTALEIGGFHRRHPQRGGPDVAPVVSAAEAARLIRGWIFAPWQGRKPVLSGFNPAFDEAGLADLLYRHGGDPDEQPWDYHLQCAKTYAAGYLGWTRPYSTDDLLTALGIEISEELRGSLHTAVTDAAIARRIREAVQAAPRPTGNTS